MAVATVYTIKNEKVVSQFDMDYEEAIKQFWGKSGYYVARKGIAIPYQFQKGVLKDVRPQDHPQ